MTKETNENNKKIETKKPTKKNVEILLINLFILIF